MSGCQTCATVRENIRHFNQRSPVVYQEYVDANNLIPRLEFELERLRTQYSTLEGADRAASVAVSLSLSHPAAWAIIQSLRAATLGEAKARQQERIRDKERELRDARRTMADKDREWRAIQENLARSQEAWVTLGCDDC